MEGSSHKLQTLSLLCAVTALSIATGLVQRPSVAGDYARSLGSLHINLHIKSNQGKLTWIMDSPNRGAKSIPWNDFQLDGQSFSAAVHAANRTWKGMVDAESNHLTGPGNQQQSFELKVNRDTSQPTSKPSPVDGVWLGTLAAGGVSLRIQIEVNSDSTGHQHCTLDSLDQHAMDLKCENVKFSTPDFSFDVPAVKGHWKGTIASDGKSLNGTWTQAHPLALNFSRQKVGIASLVIEDDPAMAPVQVTDLQAVLEKDLARALSSGQLAPSTGAGVTIGLVQHGIRRIFSYGATQPDSIFEIGSITKTFTGLILAQLVEQNSVNLSDPVRVLLPPGTVSKPIGAEITLGDLATQHSGLPRLPTNLNPKDKKNPYADYTTVELYAFLAKQGLREPANAGFLYSNLGFGLLGQLLRRLANTRSAGPNRTLLATDVSTILSGRRELQAFAIIFASA